MWNKNIQIEHKLKFWLLDVKSLSYRIRNIAKLEIIPIETRVSNIFWLDMILTFYVYQLFLFYMI